MPRKYDEKTKAKAIRVVSSRLGMNSETLRRWLRQAEIDSGERDGVTNFAGS